MESCQSTVELPGAAAMEIVPLKVCRLEERGRIGVLNSDRLDLSPGSATSLRVLWGKRCNNSELLLPHCKMGTLPLVMGLCEDPERGNKVRVQQRR